MPYFEEEEKMAKGDKRTAKGKRFRGTHGNSRPKPRNKRKLKAKKLEQD